MELYVMVGLTGLGKSTLIEDIKKTLTGEPFIYSTDDYISNYAKITGSTYDAVFKDTIKDATSYMDKELLLAIKNNSAVMWDQTNMTSKKRKSIISKFPEDTYKECRVIITPKEEKDILEWERRLKSRTGKTIPGNIIASMRSSYTRPSLEEGFDKIQFYDMYGNSKEINTKRISYVE